ncbi:MAG: hypothetical protein LC797_19135, partial [Chloroflexi bacterium]|nr:hypothetical protein [Chloroflexota bacterium]
PLMRIDGVGELTYHGTYWRLTYDSCRHVQEFARLDLDDSRARDDPERAALEVQRHYAWCLSCKVQQSQRG